MGRDSEQQRANDQRERDLREKNRERRFGLGRRIRGDRRVMIGLAVAHERRSGAERRTGSNRRSGPDRRRDKRLGTSL
jgi:hypothetical protein